MGDVSGWWLVGASTVGALGWALFFIMVAAWHKRAARHEWELELQRLIEPPPLPKRPSVPPAPARIVRRRLTGYLPRYAFDDEPDPAA